MANELLIKKTRSQKNWNEKSFSFNSNEKHAKISYCESSFAKNRRNYLWLYAWKWHDIQWIFRFHSNAVVISSRMTMNWFFLALSFCFHFLFYHKECFSAASVGYTSGSYVENFIWISTGMEFRCVNQKIGIYPTFIQHHNLLTSIKIAQFTILSHITLIVSLRFIDRQTYFSLLSLKFQKIDIDWNRLSVIKSYHRLFHSDSDW